MRLNNGMIGVRRNLSVGFAMGDEPTVWAILPLPRTQEASRHLTKCTREIANTSQERALVAHR